MRAPAQAEKLSEERERVEREIERAERDIEKALTVDPAFLERRVLSLLGVAYANNIGLSFRDFKKELHTTNSRLTRNLASLCKRGIVTRKALRHFPPLTDYRLTHKEAAARALTYWAEDSANLHLLGMAIRLRESLHTNLQVQRGEKLFENVRKIIVQVLALLAGDVKEAGSLVFSKEAYSVKELALRARHGTPMLVYGFYTLGVCASILELLGKTEEERMHLYEECVESVLKHPQTLDLDSLLKKASIKGDSERIENA